MRESERAVKSSNALSNLEAWLTDGPAKFDGCDGPGGAGPKIVHQIAVAARQVALHAQRVRAIQLVQVEIRGEVRGQDGRVGDALREIGEKGGR